MACCCAVVVIVLVVVMVVDPKVNKLARLYAVWDGMWQVYQPLV